MRGWTSSVPGGLCASPSQGWRTWGPWRGGAGELLGTRPGGVCYRLLSVSLAMAQRLRKLDFPVKDSEEPSTPGPDKNHFLRPREPGEDTGKVSALTPRARAPPSPGLRCVGGGQPAQPGAAARGGEARALSSLPERTAEFRGPGESVFIYVTYISWPFWECLLKGGVGLPAPCHPAPNAEERGGW